MEKQKRLTIDMDPDTHTLIKDECADIGISMKEFMIEAALRVINTLDKLEPKEAEKFLKAFKEITYNGPIWEEVTEEDRLRSR